MKKYLMLAFILGLANCTTQTVYPTSAKYSKSAKPSYKKSQAFFIYGLGQSKEKNANEICGNKTPVEITSKTTFVDGLLGMVTWGIYTPRTLEIYCE